MSLRVAYVDTSLLLVVAFGQPGASKAAALLRSYQQLLSGTLLEAEFHAAHAREEVEVREGLLGRRGLRGS